MNLEVTVPKSDKTETDVECPKLDEVSNDVCEENGRMKERGEVGEDRKSRGIPHSARTTGGSTTAVRFRNNSAWLGYYILFIKAVAICLGSPRSCYKTGRSHSAHRTSPYS